MMGSVAPVFTPLAATEHEAVAELLHRALVGWYETRLGQGSRFGDRSEPFRLIPKVYAALDPGEAIAAREANGGALLGVCFVHPRPTHLSVGIVAVAPEAQGRGIARGLLTRALARADELRVPARLVSSLLNLDSYSLYTRHGFVPEEVYQDVVITVPVGGLDLPPSVRARVASVRVRQAEPGEAENIAAYEHARRGIHRPADHALFLANRVGDWRVWVAEDAAGALTGYLVASVHPHHRAVGPGAVDDDVTAEALLLTALDAYRGGSALVLVPAAAAGLVAHLYALGGRNVELHVAQVRPVPGTRGAADAGGVGIATGTVDADRIEAASRSDPARGLAGVRSRGWAFPTFLPESA
jgi:GNAT superfamily N-acetyltransferase